MKRRPGAMAPRRLKGVSQGWRVANRTRRVCWIKPGHMAMPPAHSRRHGILHSGSRQQTRTVSRLEAHRAWRRGGPVRKGSRPTEPRARAIALRWHRARPPGRNNGGSGGGACSYTKLFTPRALAEGTAPASAFRPPNRPQSCGPLAWEGVRSGRPNHRRAPALYTAMI